MIEEVYNGKGIQSRKNKRQMPSPRAELKPKNLMLRRGHEQNRHIKKLKKADMAHKELKRIANASILPAVLWRGYALRECFPGANPVIPVMNRTRP